MRKYRFVLLIFFSYFNFNAFFDLISRHIVHMSDIQTYVHDFFLCMMQVIRCFKIEVLTFLTQCVYRYCVVGRVFLFRGMAYAHDLIYYPTAKVK